MSKCNCDCSPQNSSGAESMMYYSEGGWTYWHPPISHGCPHCGTCPRCGRYLNPPPIKWVWCNDGPPMESRTVSVSTNASDDLREAA